MKKAKGLLMVLVLMVLALTGCQTANQLAAEQAYYEMIAEVAQQQQAQPLFRLTPEKPGEPIVMTNVKSFEVFSPAPNIFDALRQYQHRDFTPGWVAPVIAIGAPIATGYGFSLIAKELSGYIGSNTYNQNISGQNNTGRLTGQAFSNASVNGNSNTVGGTIHAPSTTTTTTTTTTNTDVNNNKSTATEPTSP